MISSRSEVAEKVLRVVKEQTGCGDIQLTSSFESLGVDSLDMIEAVLDLEDEFGIKIPDTTVFNTVQDCVNLVCKQIGVE